MATETFEKATSVEQIAREANRFKDIITEAVDEGFQSAVQAIQQGRRAAENAMDDAEMAVTQNPLGTMGIVLGAGVLIGIFATWMAMRNR